MEPRKQQQTTESEAQTIKLNKMHPCILNQNRSDDANERENNNQDVSTEKENIQLAHVVQDWTYIRRPVPCTCGVQTQKRHTLLLTPKTCINCIRSFPAKVTSNNVYTAL